MAAPSKSLIMRVIAASVSVSNRAAVIVRDVSKKGDLGIIEKGENDYQTEADRMAQKCIVASLNRHFPKIQIYGEEDLDASESISSHLLEKEFCTDVLAQKCPPVLTDIRDEEVVIWVDPVDGTLEYTEGFLDRVTILIGVAVRGKATGGVINQPFYNYRTTPTPPHPVLGRCVWGLVGLGGFGFEPSKPPVGQNIITTSMKHRDESITAAIEACQPTELLRVGGAGYKMLQLMEGKAHAYVYANPGNKKWDMCAPEAVLHSIGGCVTDLQGQPLHYHGGPDPSVSSGFVATAPGVDHAWYISRLPQHIKEKFRRGGG